MVKVLRPQFLTAFLFVTLYLLVFITDSCITSDNGSQTTGIYLNLHDTVKYVGMQTCRGCHTEIYESYIKTGMGKSFDLSSPQKSAADFSGHPVVHDQFSGLSYHPFWEGDSLRIIEFRIEKKDTVHKRIEPITYIIGSGQHTNSHITNIGGSLYQVPLTYYTQTKQWDLPPGYENDHNSRFKRKIGLECMSCHNAFPDIVSGSENKYRFVPKGIDCERCHGPGEIHVNNKMAGIRVDTSGYIDYSIVNPGKLTPSLQMEVCQRCHIQGNTVLNEGKSFFDFKPGMRLSEVMDVYMPVYQGMEQEHIMASHVERLKMSKCYIETTHKIETGLIKPKDHLRPAKDALTCITCHNPHISVTLTGTSVFNRACKNCHEPNGTLLCTEKPVPRKLKNDNCVACHMKKSGTIDIPHVSTTDHFIRKPMDKRDEDNLRVFLGLKSINNPNPDKRSLGKAYINYFEKFESNPAFLDSALVYFPLKSRDDLVRNFRQLIHIYFLKNDFAQIIRYNRLLGNTLDVIKSAGWENDDAWTAYRIGEAYFSTHELILATGFFQRAHELAPGVAEFGNKYGVSLLKAGKTKQARLILLKIFRENPRYAPVISNLGYVELILNKDTDRAMQLYDLAISLDPDYEQALLNKAGLLFLQQKKAQAMQLVTKVLELNSQNALALQLKKQITNR
jgi:hypothetical protein